jgi:hypothetical protein
VFTHLPAFKDDHLLCASKHGIGKVGYVLKNDSTNQHIGEASQPV